VSVEVVVMSTTKQRASVVSGSVKDALEKPCGLACM